MSVADTTVKHYINDMGGCPSVGTTAGSLIAAINTLIAGFGSKTLASLVIGADGITATGTVTAGHGFIMRGNTGPVITIAGATPSGLNGNWRIATIANSTTFTFITSGLSAGSATGTITAAIAGLPMTLVSSGTNTATFKFTDVTANQAYLHIDDTTTNYATTIMYSTMTGTDTGTNGTPATYIFKGTTSNFFTDNKALYLGVLSTATLWSTGFFGDIVPCNSADVYATAIMLNGGNNPSSTASYTFPLLNSTTATYLLGDYNQTASNVAALRMTHAINWTVPGAIAYPNPGSNQMLATPIDVFNGAKTNYRGTMPGLYSTMHPTATFTQAEIISGNIDMFMQLAMSAASVIYPMAINLTGPWR